MPRYEIFYHERWHRAAVFEVEANSAEEAEAIGWERALKEDLALQPPEQCDDESDLDVIEIHEEDEED